jgi:phosphohistidine phosphatase
MRQIAQGLKELTGQVDLILTSPALRAAQTAKILRKAFDLKKDKLVETERLAPLGNADLLINEINEKHADAQGILLVGHEPYLSSLVSVLLSGDVAMPLILKKGGVCHLSVERLIYGRCAALNWLLTPSQLVKIGS